MSLRRNRSHKTGISNIDFRTKRDEENLRIFEPWQTPKNFGTMGYKNYHNPIVTFKKLFSPSEGINTHKDIVNEYPDPRYYTTSQFYKANSMLPKTKSFYNTERVSNLEETFKGKEVFNGDGMSIADTFKQRKQKKKTFIVNLDLDLNNIDNNNSQKNLKEKLVHDKDKLNSNIQLETQLVKINAQKTENNFVNINKIKEIRLALKRRYGNRKNITKIFQQWAKTYPNKITDYDVFKMVNAFCIPININEAKVLIASASLFGKDYLNIKEFSHLILNENNHLGDEPFKIKTQVSENENIFGKENQEDFKEKIINKNREMEEISDIIFLKEFIAHKILLFTKNIKELHNQEILEKYGLNNNTNGQIVDKKYDFDKFYKSIRYLNPPKKYCTKKLVESLFNEYKEKDGFIDPIKFSRKIYDSKEIEFLSQLKDRTNNKHQEKYDKLSNELKYLVKNNLNQKELIYKKKSDLDGQISEKKEEEKKCKKEEDRKSLEINNTIPSTPWLHHVYDKRKEHYNILNRAEHAFSAKPIMRKTYFTQTRFGANPAWKNTAEILIGKENDPTYISEKDRFNTDRNLGIDEKLKKEQIRSGRINRIRTAIQKVQEINYMTQYLQNEKEKLSQLNKIKNQLDYEDRIKRLNYIIE